MDTGYLALCRRTALRAAECLGWVRVPCVDPSGALRSVEDIQQEIWGRVAPVLDTAHRA